MKVCQVHYASLEFWLMTEASSSVFSSATSFGSSQKNSGISAPHGPLDWAVVKHLPTLILHFVKWARFKYLGTFQDVLDLKHKSIRVLVCALKLDLSEDNYIVSHSFWHQSRANLIKCAVSICSDEAELEIIRLRFSWTMVQQANLIVSPPTLRP